MKTSALTLLLCLANFVVQSQSDTIFKKDKGKIACKIVEINESEIKYRLAELPDGPIYTIYKYSARKYCLSSSFCELLIPDELSLDNEHEQIVNNRAAIKLHPFSIANNHISLAYEKVLKVGTNLDVQIGYINTNINPSVNSGYYGNPFRAGAYIKPGMKFFIGQDFSVRGLKYAHPLKGRYIKLELALSYLNYHNLERTIATRSGNTYVYSTITSDMNIAAYGGFVNFGRQFILGNVITLEYYAGTGFSGSSFKYSNPLFDDKSAGNAVMQSETGPNVSNYYGFFRIPYAVGLSFTCGFRIGYILAPKEVKRAKQPQTN